MKTLTSLDNPRLKELKKLLTDKAYRAERGLFVIEGYHLFQYAKDLVSIFVRDGETVPKTNLSANAIFSVSSRIFKAISDTENGQGVIGICKIPGKCQVSRSGKYVYLDRIQDPGNMGTIIRTAAGFGWDGVLYSKGSVDPYSPKVVRATMGGIFTIPVRATDHQELQNIKVVVADLNGEKPEPIADGFILVIGSESQGVSPEIAKLAVKKVAIPITKNVESLNASIAAGILMYLLG